MSEEAVAPRPRRRALGCLAWALAATAAIVGLVIAIGLIFDQGDSADQPVRGLDAGPAEGYGRGDVTHLEAEGVFVVRLQDGSFITLYDRSPRQQAIHDDCRVRYDEQGTTGGADQVPGFTGTLIEECGRIVSAWLVDGTRAFGGGFGDLDRFDNSIDANGHLIVRLDSRTCTKSAGDTGVAPYTLRRCGRP